jgi:hypothetical protein
MGDEEAAEFCFSVVARCSDGASTAAAAAPSSGPRPHPPPQPPLLVTRGALEVALAACSAAAIGQPADPTLVSAAAEGALALAPPSGPAAAGAGSNPAAGLSPDGYAKWAAAWPALRTALRSLFLSVGRRGALPAGGPPSTSPSASPPAAAGPRARAPAPREPPWGRGPELTDLGRAAASDLLLQPFSAWMLAGCLPPELGKSWRCVFNSQRDGKSFNR